MSAQLSQLRVGDESFLVTSMIERCPKVMMLRELVKNALEAAATAPAGGRQVRISSVPIEGFRKLAIWNTGRGMDADELFRMCDIASSIRKEHRLDQNFGMGAKVASLPSNRHGLRYRSCHDGIVNEVMLGYRDGVYGRLRRLGPDGQWQDVMDATADAEAEGRDPSIDWTEVVLFGNAPEQDTMDDPYHGAPGMAAHWIPEELAYKFYRLDPGVELLFDEHQAQRFQPLAERIPANYTRHETVTLPDGVRLHYVHDAADPDDPNHSDASPGTLFPLHGACGLVYKDELYDAHRWHQWLHIAPIFGIPFAVRSLSVFIELPEGFGIVPDGYRQFLRYADGSQAEVQCRHFADTVHRHRPDWLVALIESQAPTARMAQDVSDGLDRLLRDLKVRRRPRAAAPSLRPEADRELEPEAEPESEREREPEAAGQDPEPIDRTEPPDLLPGAEAESEPRRQTEQPPPTGEDAAEADMDFEPPPEILMLREPAEIDARALTGWAARYYPETHQLFLNGLYPAVTAMREQLQSEFAWVPDQERVRAQALQLAEQSLAARVGRLLVFGLSKHGTWNDHDMMFSQSVQSLSLVADDYGPSLDAARRAMGAHA